MLGIAEDLRLINFFFFEKPNVDLSQNRRLRRARFLEFLCKYLTGLVCNFNENTAAMEGGRQPEEFSLKFRESEFTS